MGGHRAGRAGGDHDGSIDGVEYFVQDKHGIMVRPIFVTEFSEEALAANQIRMLHARRPRSAS